ncbi:hypothetical protein C5167_032809 [Papaver somniferum]|uniref:Uncharacterized protein n=1 Tax=Papaver somniferum TaxID=3469 RepID=A0A4Y7KBE9_PAPSO|nr:hypothetical protein C5167_032809 [Papaver somniferum]
MSPVQNIAPVLDSVLDYHDDKHDQMFACCGVAPEGSLRIIRSGISVENLLRTAPIYQGITGTWTSRMKVLDSFDSFLVLSFVEETRVLSVGLSFSDVTDAVGFQPDACTLACGLECRETLFATTIAHPEGIPLSAPICTSWFPDNVNISLGAVGQNMIIVATSNPCFLFILGVRSLSAYHYEIYEMQHVRLQNEVSSISIPQRISEYKSSTSVVSLPNISKPCFGLPIGVEISDTFVIGTHRPSVEILSFVPEEGLRIVACGIISLSNTLGTAISGCVPQDVRLVLVDRLYVLSGLRNGMLLRFEWPNISTLPPSLELPQQSPFMISNMAASFVSPSSSNKQRRDSNILKKAGKTPIHLELIAIRHIGVTPVFLVPLCDSLDSDIIALSDRPWLLQTARHSLSFTSISFQPATHVTPVCSMDCPKGILFVAENRLHLVEMVHSKRLNVQKFSLGGTPRKVVYHSESRLLLVMRTELSGESCSSDTCCVDPLSGSLLSSFKLEPGETGKSMQLVKVGNERVLMVGTNRFGGRAIMHTGEAERLGQPDLLNFSKGRLLVLCLEHTLKSVNSSFREIVGYATEQLSSSSLCSSPEDNGFEGVKLEETEVWQLVLAYQTIIPGVVLAVCPYLDRYFLASAEFTRIVVGDCRDGVIFYSYDEEPRRLKQLYCDPVQRLVADCTLMDMDTAVVSDRKGNLTVLSCPNRVEEEIQAYLSIRSKLTYLLRWLDLYQVTCTNATIYDKVDVVYHMKAYSRLLMDKVAVALIQSQTCSHQHYEFVRADRLEHTLKSVNSSFREIVGYATEQLSSSSLCSSPEDNGFEGVKLEETEVWQLVLAYQTIIPGVVLAVCPYLDRYFLASAEFTRIVVGDCRDGVIFYSYDEIERETLLFCHAQIGLKLIVIVRGNSGVPVHQVKADLPIEVARSVAVALIQSQTCSHQHYEFVRADRLEHTLKSVNSSFREIVGYATEQLSSSSLCSSPEDNGFEGVKLEETEVWQLVLAYQTIIPGVVLAVCPYLDQFTRIVVGDCRDGVIFYSYDEEPRRLKQLYCDPVQRLVADCTLMDMDTAVVSDRKGNLTVLSCPNRVEEEIQAYLSIRSKLTYLLRWLDLYQVTCTNATIYDKVDVVYHMKAYSRLLMDKVAVALIQSQTCSHQHYEFVRADRLEHTLKSVNSSFREIVGYATEQLSSSSLCSSPEDNGFEGVKLEETEVWQLVLAYQTIIPGVVLAVCPYLDRYFLASAEFTRIVVGDCRDGVIFYSYDEEPRRLKQLYCDPVQRLVADCTLMDMDTAVVSDRKGNLTVLSCPNRVEEEIQAYLSIRSKLTYLLRWLDLYQVTCTNATIYDKVDVVYHMKAYSRLLMDKVAVALIQSQTCSHQHYEFVRADRLEHTLKSVNSSFREIVGYATEQLSSSSLCSSPEDNGFEGVKLEETEVWQLVLAYQTIIPGVVLAVCPYLDRYFLASAEFTRIVVGDCRDGVIFYSYDEEPRRLKQLYCDPVQRLVADCTPLWTWTLLCWSQIERETLLFLCPAPNRVEGSYLSLLEEIQAYLSIRSKLTYLLRWLDLYQVTCTNATIYDKVDVVYHMKAYSRLLMDKVAVALIQSQTCSHQHYEFVRADRLEHTLKSVNSSFVREIVGYATEQLSSSSLCSSPADNGFEGVKLEETEVWQLVLAYQTIIPGVVLAVCPYLDRYFLASAEFTRIVVGDCDDGVIFYSYDEEPRRLKQLYCDPVQRLVADCTLMDMDTAVVSDRKGNLTVLSCPNRVEEEIQAYLSIRSKLTYLLRWLDLYQVTCTNATIYDKVDVVYHMKAYSRLLMDKVAVALIQSQTCSHQHYEFVRADRLEHTLKSVNSSFREIVGYATEQLSSSSLCSSPEDNGFEGVKLEETEVWQLVLAYQTIIPGVVLAVCPYLDRYFLASAEFTRIVVGDCRDGVIFYSYDEEPRRLKQLYCDPVQRLVADCTLMTWTLLWSQIERETLLFCHAQIGLKEIQAYLSIRSKLTYLLRWLDLYQVTCTNATIYDKVDVVYHMKAYSRLLMDKVAVALIQSQTCSHQ